MTRLAAGLLTCVLVAAACGGPDSNGVTTSTSAGVPTAEPPSTPSTPTASVAARAVVSDPSAGVQRAQPDPAAPIAEFVGGFNDAGFGLWQSQPAGDNLVFSPASIGHALLMARGAADDPTGDAIDNALGLPPGLSAHEAWNAVDQAMAQAAGAEDELTVTVADAIFPRLDVEPSQEWVDVLTAQHGAGVERLDFAGDPEASRQRINGWISEQTQGLIPDLLPAGFIEPLTVLVLADAIYFEARWGQVFGKYGPVNDTFTRLDGSTVAVEFMQELELRTNRGVGEGYAAAELPYVGGEFSMLLIVPDQGRFEQFRAELNSDRLSQIDAELTPGPFELWLPKWKTNTTLDLEPWLRQIGASPGSYPDISQRATLAAAVHAADIAVDEQGTVAAAATAFGFEEEGGPEPGLQIKADQPFLYLIRHKPSGLILFAGQVTDPTS